eukprot:TRINITY_DN4167_c0_g1_i1.p2 TRINITY_DN4167_c0_g1~~TRINITY_DN4167_c0_g1_i1.p2  ORF type:complete len:225 (+),score=60.39 TRINITY_DN4167_c0_g1_i1:49-675(+)
MSQYSTHQEKKVCCTDAMGLNLSPSSIEGWRQLVRKEDAARQLWRLAASEDEKKKQKARQQPPTAAATNSTEEEEKGLNTKAATTTLSDKEQLLKRLRQRQEDIIQRSRAEQQLLSAEATPFAATNTPTNNTATTLTPNDHRGRIAYLKHRLEVNPQAKYRRPITTSQAIGWQCTELPPVTSAVNRNGHKPVVQSSFFRRSGVAFTGN